MDTNPLLQPNSNSFQQNLMLQQQQNYNQQAGQQPASMQQAHDQKLPGYPPQPHVNAFNPYPQPSTMYKTQGKTILFLKKNF